MSNETSRIRAQTPVQIELASAISAGDIWQLPYGLTGCKKGGGGAIGDDASFDTGDIWSVQKAASIVFLDGSPVWFDRDARTSTFRRVNGRDMYLGLCVGGAAAADERVAVAFNAEQRYDLDLLRDPFRTAIVGTQALGGLGLYNRGGALHFMLDATNEAQKVDALGVDPLDIDGNGIVEGCFRVISDGAGSAPDFSIGVASATHATDADSIAEHLLIHLDGNSVNINMKSKDGTTTVTATDTTKDYTEGATVSARTEFTFDLSDPGNINVYINAIRVLTSTRFRLDNGTGPLFLFAHLEKTAAADVYEVAVDKLRARTSEQ